MCSNCGTEHILKIIREYQQTNVTGQLRLEIVNSRAECSLAAGVVLDYNQKADHRLLKPMVAPKSLEHFISLSSHALNPSPIQVSSGEQTPDLLLADAVPHPNYKQRGSLSQRVQRSHRKESRGHYPGLSWVSQKFPYGTSES